MLNSDLRYQQLHCELFVVSPSLCPPPVLSHHGPAHPLTWRQPAAAPPFGQAQTRLSNHYPDSLTPDTKLPPTASQHRWPIANQLRKEQNEEGEPDRLIENKKCATWESHIPLITVRTGYNTGNVTGLFHFPSFKWDHLMLRLLKNVINAKWCVF